MQRRGPGSSKPSRKPAASCGAASSAAAPVRLHLLSVQCLGSMGRCVRKAASKCQSAVVTDVKQRSRHHVQTYCFFLSEDCLPQSAFINAGGHGTSSGDHGSRDNALHGGVPHTRGPSLPVRPLRPAAAAPADSQRERQHAVEQAGISAAAARVILEQLAADIRAHRAGRAAAHQQNWRTAAAQAGVNTAEARRLLQQLATDLGVRRSGPAAAAHQQDRQLAAAPAGIDMAEARAWLLQLAADMEALRAGPAAAQQPELVGPAAVPQPQAVELPAVPRPEPAGLVVPANDGPLAAIRALLLVGLTHARRYSGMCAAVGHAALSMNWGFMLAWRRAAVSEAALQVRGCIVAAQLVAVSLLVALEQPTAQHPGTWHRLRMSPIAVASKVRSGDWSRLR